MIITKKQYNEAIEKAVEKTRAEERAQFDKMMCDRDEERWRNERIENIERRMSSAFGDIDRSTYGAGKEPERWQRHSGMPEVLRRLNGIHP